MKSLKDFKAALTWGSTWSRYSSARDVTVIGRVCRVQGNGVYFDNGAWFEFPKASNLMFIDNHDGVPAMRITHPSGTCYLIMKPVEA